MFLFAYGSNMSEVQMSQRLSRHAKQVAVAKAEGYKFGYYGHSQNWQKCGSADIVPCEDGSCSVWGVVYEVDQSDLEKLDEFEHVTSGRYKRAEIKVKLNDDRTIDAVTYVLKRDELPERANEPLSLYRSLCVESARIAGLPGDYIRRSIES